jgi:hypothetical protein
MTNAFDITQNCTPKAGGGSACWTYTAAPSSILSITTLPLPASNTVDRATLHTTHDAAWWAAKTKGMDFSQEDLNDPAAFNRIIWEGMMGNKPLSHHPLRRNHAARRNSAAGNQASQQHRVAVEERQRLKCCADENR